jgi:hypothetical protein
MNTSLNYDENNAANFGEIEKQVSNITSDILAYIEEPEAWQLEDLDDFILSYE